MRSLHVVRLGPEDFDLLAASLTVDAFVVADETRQTKSKKIIFFKRVLCNNHFTFFF